MFYLSLDPRAKKSVHLARAHHAAHLSFLVAKKQHEISALLETVARVTWDLALEVACDKGSLHLRERELITRIIPLCLCPRSRETTVEMNGDFMGFTDWNYLVNFSRNTLKLQVCLFNLGVDSQTKEQKKIFHICRLGIIHQDKSGCLVSNENSDLTLSCTIYLWTQEIYI